MGCLLYHFRHYEQAAALWETCGDPVSRRNLAVAYFSHLNRPDEALAIMTALTKEYPTDQELVYETVCLMDKMGVDPAKKIALITAHTVTRDDILTELAKAYNQVGQPDEALHTLLSHDFVPCEGGEHAIADQYMFAHLVKGRRALEQNDLPTALGLFREGQVLPQSLGAGIWNHCKRIPLKYHEAVCLERLGERDAAAEIFRYIANTTIEYFSNMHLKELPYYQAKSFDHLGESLKGQHLITRTRRQWEKIAITTDNGYFGTTPFFIPFVDDPKRLRQAQYRYLIALCDEYQGNSTAAKENMARSATLNNENLFALFFDQGNWLM